MAGWSSNSKYAFLGGLRSAAQMISYEVSMGVTLLSVLVLTGSLNYSTIVESQKNIWLYLPLFPIFFNFFCYCISRNKSSSFWSSRSWSRTCIGL